MARASTPRRPRSPNGCSPSARRRWGPSTPTWAPRSTTWPCCTRPRAATPRPSRSTGAASPSARRRWGPSTPTWRTSLNNLAELYQAQGRYAEAEPLYRRSLAIREKALGPEHPDVGTSLNNLAELYRAQGRYAEAEPLYRRSLAICEKALGPEHPDVGTLAQQPGRAVPGPGPLRRGRAALQAQPRHPREGAGARAPRRGADRSTTWPLLYQAPGPLRRGRAALHGAASAISEKALGPEHPDVAFRSLNNLAALAIRSQKRLGERAADYWRRSTGDHQAPRRARSRRRHVGGGIREGRRSS